MCLAACRQKRRVRFTTAAVLVNELVEAKQNIQLRKLMMRCQKYELIALAEVGYVPLADSWRCDIRTGAYWNAGHQSSGHVWQGRYDPCPLDPPHMWRALRYTELNPVRAGLVSEAKLWEWSKRSGRLRSWRRFQQAADGFGLTLLRSYDRLEIDGLLMNSKTKLDQIAENKKRNSHLHGYVAHDLRNLKEQYRRNLQNHSGVSDFYLIRCVTFLEVLTRVQVAALCRPR